MSVTSTQPGTSPASLRSTSPHAVRVRRTVVATARRPPRACAASATGVGDAVPGAGFAAVPAVFILNMSIPFWAIGPIAMSCT